MRIDALDARGRLVVRGELGAMRGLLLGVARPGAFAAQDVRHEQRGDVVAERGRLRRVPAAEAFFAARCGRSCATRRSAARLRFRRTRCRGLFGGLRLRRRIRRFVQRRIDDDRGLTIAAAFAVAARPGAARRLCRGAVAFGVDVDLAVARLETAPRGRVLQQQRALLVGQARRVQRGARAGLQFLVPDLVARGAAERGLAVADHLVADDRPGFERGIGRVVEIGRALGGRQRIQVRADQQRVIPGVV